MTTLANNTVEMIAYTAVCYIAFVALAGLVERIFMVNSKSELRTGIISLILTLGIVTTKFQDPFASLVVVAVAYVVDNLRILKSKHNV